MVPDIGDFIVGSAAGIDQCNLAGGQSAVEIAFRRENAGREIRADVLLGQGRQSGKTDVDRIVFPRIEGSPVPVNPDLV